MGLKMDDFQSQEAYTTEDSENISIFVADDNQEFRDFIVTTLLNEGHKVIEYNPLEPDYALLKKKYSVAVLDIMMPEYDGFEIHDKLLVHSPDIQTIMVTGCIDREKHKKATDNGIFMFLIKPVRVEQLIYSVAGAVKMNKLHKNSNRFKIEEEYCDIPDLVGKSKHIIDVKKSIYEFAPVDIPVLITGESGTGKEVVAKSIYENSSRASKPFITVNCAGLSPNLIESELFGHVQGAFTGATKTRHGFFAAANGGTILLDEIGELPLYLQSKLLRVLDTGEFYRVGESYPQKVNVRIISATNRDLEKMMHAGEFRRDLYFRICGVKIELQPLRNRIDDMVYLVYHFLNDTDIVLTNGAIELLKKLDWPGNIRELSTFIKTLKARSNGTVVTETHIKNIISSKKMVSGDFNNINDINEPASIPKFSKYRNLCDEKYLKNLIEMTDGNISKASQISGIHRKNLRDKLKALGLYQNSESLKKNQSDTIFC